MGTFSKSLASCGGFIAGPADVIDYLRISSRPFLFTAAAVPAATAAALEAVRICRSAEGAELFARVLDNAAYLHRGLRELGFRVVEPSRLPDGTRGRHADRPGRDRRGPRRPRRSGRRSGTRASTRTWPSTPPFRRGGSLIRTSVMATHEREHLDRALEIFEGCSAVRHRALSAATA